MVRLLEVLKDVSLTSLDISKTGCGVSTASKLAELLSGATKFSAGIEEVAWGGSIDPSLHARIVEICARNKATREGTINEPEPELAPEPEPKPEPEPESEPAPAAEGEPPEHASQGKADQRAEQAEWLLDETAESLARQRERWGAAEQFAREETERVREAGHLVEEAERRAQDLQERLTREEQQRREGRERENS